MDLNLAMEAFLRKLQVSTQNILKNAFASDALEDILDKLKEDESEQLKIYDLRDFV